MLRVVGPEAEMTIAEDEVVVVGRGADAHLVIDHPSLSRRHLELSCASGVWVATDLDSRNGVYVNGARLRRFRIDGELLVHLASADSPVRLHLTVVPDQPGPDATPAAPGARRRDVEIGRLSAIVRPSTHALSIGRAADNDVTLDDLLVSRHHARLETGTGQAVLRDLGSHNGTFVNGARVDQATLEAGDLVAIGRTIFRWTSDTLEQYEDTGEISLTAAGLTVTAGDTVLVDDIRFDLERSSLLAVVGPSGAGKSTLLAALAGLRPADAGHVFFGGRDLYESYEDLRRRIGFVPQDDIVHAELTVRQALGYAAELRFAADVTAGERAERVDEVLVELGLAGRADLAVHRLSGGQRKRVSVAMELLTRPSLLFLDEPTSGLDPGLELTLMQLFRRLADSGRTVVVVTHSTESLHLCDRVLFLTPGGKTAYYGPPTMAVDYFGLADYQEVFQALTASDPDGFAQRYRASAMAAGEADVSTRPRKADPELRPVPRRGGAWRQFSTLSRRYARIMLADRKNLWFLLAGAPLLGLLMLWRLPTDQLGPLPVGQIRLISQAPLVILTLVIGITQLGATNGVREIVKELPILRRERAAGLSIAAYIGSKVVILGAITLVQAAILTSIAVAAQDGPQDAVLLGWPLGELIVVVAVTGIGAMALGLLVSALVSTVDRALTLLPVVLVFQIVLASGGVFPEGVDKPVLKQASYLSTTQWGFAASGSTIELNELQAVNEIARQVPVIDVDDIDRLPELALDDADRGDAFWNHTAKAWAADMAALAALTVASVVVAGLALRRYDPF